MTVWEEREAKTERQRKEEEMKRRKRMSLKERRSRGKGVWGEWGLTCEMSNSIGEVNWVRVDFCGCWTCHALWITQKSHYFKAGAITSNFHLSSWMCDQKVYSALICMLRVTAAGASSAAAVGLCVQYRLMSECLRRLCCASVPASALGSLQVQLWLHPSG